MRSQTPAGKAAKIQELVQFLPQFMEKTEKLLKKSDGEYFVGGKVRDR